MIRLEEMYDEFVKSLESMTYEEIMQSIEQARKDSEDSEIFDSDYYGLEHDKQAKNMQEKHIRKHGINERTHAFCLDSGQWKKKHGVMKF